ncbi:hypothetical protein L9F63_001700, partial [Diploptera punctata]
KISSDSSVDRGNIDNSNLHYEGDICVYTDPVSKQEYLWSSDKNEWVPRSHTEKGN